jgi:hypothetical protein
MRRVLSQKFKNGEENMTLRKILAILQSLCQTSRQNYEYLGHTDLDFDSEKCLMKSRLRTTQ